MRLPEPVRDWKEPDRDDIETELDRDQRRPVCPRCHLLLPCDC